jgi:hypothetical protein
MKLFWRKYTYTFCKLDILTTLSDNIFYINEMAQLTQNMSKFLQKCFMKPTPGENSKLYLNVDHFFNTNENYASKTPHVSYFLFHRCVLCVVPIAI